MERCLEEHSLYTVRRQWQARLWTAANNENNHSEVMSSMLGWAKVNDAFIANRRPHLGSYSRDTAPRAWTTDYFCSPVNA